MQQPMRPVEVVTSGSPRRGNSWVPWDNDPQLDTNGRSSISTWIYWKIVAGIKRGSFQLEFGRCFEHPWSWLAWQYIFGVLVCPKGDRTQKYNGCQSQLGQAFASSQELQYPVTWPRFPMGSRDSFLETPIDLPPKIAWEKRSVLVNHCRRPR